MKKTIIYFIFAAILFSFFSCINEMEDISQISEAGAAASDTSQNTPFEAPTDKPPIDIGIPLPGDPLPDEPSNPPAAKEPEISNLRWGTTGDMIRKGQEADWSPDTINKGSQLWIGLDSTAVAVSIEFTVNKNGTVESHTLSPDKYNYVGLGANEGFVWALFPSTMDFAGAARVIVKVNFANVSKMLDGAFNVVQPVEAGISNLRWGATADSVKSSNKANWNKSALREDYALYAAVDFTLPANVSIDYFRFYIYKSGNEYYYTRYASSGEFTIEGNSVLMKLPEAKIGFVGQVSVKVQVKFTNGVVKELAGENFNVSAVSREPAPTTPTPTPAPVVVPKPAKVSPALYGLPEIAGISYYTFGEFPQSRLTVPMPINDVGNGRYKGSDGNYYEKHSAVRQFKASDGKTMVAGETGVYKIEPIVWKRLGASNMLMSAKVLVGGVQFYGGPVRRAAKDGTQIHANHYKHSNIRAYLNGIDNAAVSDVGKRGDGDVDWTNKGFLQKAFTEKEREIIVVRVLPNNDNRQNIAPGGGGLPNPAYLCAPTWDKVWLLSKAEVASANGFLSQWSTGIGSGRQLKVTDYARSMGASFDNETGAGMWFLRSPYTDTSKHVQAVYANGRATLSDNVGVDHTKTGTVPAIMLDESSL